MTNSLQGIHLLLARTVSADEATSTATLRQWRTDLVQALMSVSHAISVLSLDIEILNHSLTSSSEDVVQALVDNLPSILASNWIEGEWSLSPNALTPVGAEFEIDQEADLLGLHAEIVTSNLGDHKAVRDLLTRTEQERQAFFKVKGQLDDRLRQIQEVVRKQYVSGVASVDDWLA